MKAEKLKEQKYENISIKSNVQFSTLLKKPQNRRILKQLDLQILGLNNFCKDEEALIETLQCIEEYKISALHSRSCKMENILLYIKNINFSQLNSLHLESTNMASLEVIPRIEMPCLRELWISYNQIVSLKPLRKVNLPKFQILGLFGNKITSFAPLRQANFSVLQRLGIQKDEDFDDPKAMQMKKLKNISEDLSFFFKLNAVKLRIIFVAQGNRIIRKTFDQHLRKFYTSGQIKSQNKVAQVQESDSD